MLGTQALGALALGQGPSGAVIIPPVVDDVGGSVIGWDPYYYKRRNKRRDQRRDVVKFVEEVAQAPLAQAPVEIREQAQEALEAARLALQLAELDALQAALYEINEFYALIRAEAKQLRDMDEDEDEDLLLLS